jgi:hypothetical protein
LRFFAFSVRAFAAALDALVAIAFRSFALRALARARPPSLASCDLTFRINSASTDKYYTMLARWQFIYFDYA